MKKHEAIRKLFVIDKKYAPLWSELISKKMFIAKALLEAAQNQDTRIEYFKNPSAVKKIIDEIFNEGMDIDTESEDIKKPINKKQKAVKIEGDKKTDANNNSDDDEEISLD